MATSVSGLVKEFQPYARLILAVAQQYGGPGYRITSARRSRSEQETLYRRWKECPLGPDRCGIYTPAVPGTSPHERGVAIDIAGPVDPKKDPLLLALGEAWRAAGGKWPGPADPVHFQWPFG